MATSKTTSAKSVHGDDLLYRFLRDLFGSEEGEHQAVARSLLAATAIWYPPTVYSRVPVLAPYLVRDPSCRGGLGKPDEWASPNALGYLRDDNSLIKNMPRALGIVAPAQPHLNGRRMAREFVASYVWRVTVEGGDLASRRPLLNSFVPNLVWLPSQIAKLTDLEGKPVQRVLQQMSWSLYRSVPVDAPLHLVADEAWALLPDPSKDAPTEGLNVSSWNYFSPTQAFFARRQSLLRLVRDAVDQAIVGETAPKKVIASRYTDGLPTVSRPPLMSLKVFLERFSAESHVSDPRTFGTRLSAP